MKSQKLFTKISSSESGLSSSFGGISFIGLFGIFIFCELFFKFGIFLIKLLLLLLLLLISLSSLNSVLRKYCWLGLIWILLLLSLEWKVEGCCCK